MKRNADTPEDLAPTNAELRTLAARLIAAQEAGSRKLAHELHDDIGQRAAVLEIQLQTAMQALSAQPGELQPMLVAAVASAQALGDAARQLSQRVYPAVIEHLGLAPAVRALAADHRRQGGAITVTLKPLPSPIPLEIATAVYRIAEEALRNIRQHAKEAKTGLSLRATGEALCLTIADSGPGFDAAAVRRRAFGLLVMRERALMANGTLRIDSASGSGCRIQLRAPLGKA